MPGLRLCTFRHAPLARHAQVDRLKQAIDAAYLEAFRRVELSEDAQFDDTPDLNMLTEERFGEYGRTNPKVIVSNI